MSSPSRTVGLSPAKKPDESQEIPHSFHRLVACHLERCIECYAVPDFPEGGSEDVDGAKKAKVHYVLAVPMLFRSKDGMGCEKNYMLACDCEKMRRVWEMLQCGWQSTLSTYEEWCEKAQLCEHAEQLLRQDGPYFSDCLWDLNGVQICRCLDDVTLPEPAGPISLIGNTPLGLLVSVSLNRNNFPRNTVLCTNSRIFQCLDCQGPNRYSCQHCRFFANWMSKDCNDPPLKQRLNGWSLREDVHSRFGRMRTLATPAWQNLVSPLGAGQGCFTPRSMPLVKKLPEGSTYPGHLSEGFKQESFGREGNDGEENTNGGNIPADSGLAETGTGKGVGPRKCEWCLVDKPQSCFKSDAAQADGMSKKCSSCQSRGTKSGADQQDGEDAQVVVKRPKRQEQKKNLPNVLEKRCSKCGVVKPASGFYRDSKDDTGLQHWCRACCLRHGPRSNQRSVKRSQLRSFGYLKSPQMMMMAKQAQYPSGGSARATSQTPSGNAMTGFSKPPERHRMNNGHMEPPRGATIMPHTAPSNALSSIDPLPLHHLNQPRPVQILRSDPYSRLRPATPLLANSELEQFRLHAPMVSDSRLSRPRNSNWSYGMQPQRSLGVVGGGNVNPFGAANSLTPVVSSLLDPNGTRALPSRGNLVNYGANAVRNRIVNGATARDPEVFDFQGMGAGIDQDPQIFDAPDNSVDLSLFGLGIHDGGDLNDEFRNGASVGVIEGGVDGRLQYTTVPSQQSSGVHPPVPRQDAAIDLTNFQPIQSCEQSHLAPSIPQQLVSQAAHRVSSVGGHKTTSFPFQSSRAPQPIMDLPWIDPPDGASVDSQGSGSRDWSALAESLVNPNRDHDEGLKVVTGNNVANARQAAHIGTPGVSMMQPVLRDQGQAGHHSRVHTHGNPIRLLVQKPTGSRKRKPKVIKRVPPGNGSPRSDMEPGGLKRANLDAISHGQGKRRRAVGHGDGVSELDFGIGPALDCKVEMQQVACCPGCGDQRISVEFSSSGLCTLCTLSESFVKVCVSCGQVKPHRKPHRPKDSCMDCEREKCLLEPGQVVSPSSFIPGELPGDDGDLNGSSDDPLNDDANFMTMDFLRNENEQVLAGRVAGSGRHMPAPLGM